MTRKWQAEINDKSAARPSQPDWTQAELVMPEPKETVTIRLDADILRFFKRNGKGYQTRMNAVLRAYVEAHQGS